MREFIADMRTEYASMTLADWSYWAITLLTTLALLAWVISTA